jgi:hypothetical protein
MDEVIKDPITAKFIQLMDDATKDLTRASEMPERALYQDRP